MTEDFAAHVLKDMLPTRQGGGRREHPDARWRATTRCPVEALKEDRRHKALAHARQVAMYLCRKLTKGSFPEIAARFNKDHSTVISAVRKVERLRET